ncbi:MAG: hypothetical protein U0529_02110 [Thermoanaerobaculia bacterium]
MTTKKRLVDVPPPPAAPGGWGARWLASASGAGRARLEKGRALVAEGALAALAVKPGLVEAEVRDRGRSFVSVRLKVRPLNEKVFDGALKAFAERARTAGELLSGSLPEEADAVFAAAGGALLPASANEVSVACPCGETVPCRHAAAVHVGLAERFDRDPFLILLLRGKGRDEVLARLRDARARRALPAAAPSAPKRAETAAPLPLEPLPDVRPESFYRPLVPLSTLKTRFVPPEHPDALLTRLGPPPLQDEEAAKLLVEMHRAIGRGAADRLTEAEWRRVTPRGGRSGE